MKRVFTLIITCSLLTSCEKWDHRFDSRADDKLIYPDFDLRPSTWVKLDSLTESSFSDISFCDENTGMLSGFGGTVYTTRNGGETWKTINTNAQMTFLAIYLLDERTYFTARKGLYKSTDYGTTWRMCKLSPDISIFEIWFKDANVGFLSSGTGTYRTTDAGETWTKVSDATARNLQFTSNDIGYFTYGSTAVSKSGFFPGPSSSHGDIYRTTNGGKTWIEMGLDVREITSLSFISDKVGFFASNDGSLYKTIDGGETCTLIEKKDFHIYDLFFVNENQGIACTGTEISITLDGGYNFISEYKKQGYGILYNIEFPSPNIGYAIGNGGLIIKRIQ